jgi:hypothetical protein
MLIGRRIAGATLSLALAGSVAGITVAGMTAAAPASAAAAGGGNDTVQYCRSIAGLFPGDIFGPCVSYYQSHDRSAAATDVYFCKTTFVPEGNFANIGDCVSFLNQFKGT